MLYSEGLIVIFGGYYERLQKKDTSLLSLAEAQKLQWELFAAHIFQRHLSGSHFLEKDCLSVTPEEHHRIRDAATVKKLSDESIGVTIGLVRETKVVTTSPLVAINVTTKSRSASSASTSQRTSLTFFTPPVDPSTEFKKAELSSAELKGILARLVVKLNSWSGAVPIAFSSRRGALREQLAKLQTEQAGDKPNDVEQLKTKLQSFVNDYMSGFTALQSVGTSDYWKPVQAELRSSIENPSNGQEVVVEHSWRLTL